MTWFPSSPAIDAAALIVGICSLIVSACAFAATVLLWMLQWHQPAPRHRSTRVAAVARGGIAVTALITAAALGLGLTLVATAGQQAPPVAAPAASAPEEPETKAAPGPPPDSSPSADPSAVPDATEGGGGLVDLGQSQAASRLVQVTEASVPVGAADGDQPWPTMDGLCFQLGRSSAAWLPGQVEAWDGAQETKAALTPREIFAPEAAYTWSCTRGGERLTQAELNYNCATFYGPEYLAAVINPDNAYTWVCRPLT